MLGIEFLLGLVLLLSFAFPYLVPLAALGWFFLKYHEKIIAFLVRVPTAIGQIHLALGRHLVKAVREYPLREYWKDIYYKSWILRLAIIIWLLIIPGLFFVNLALIRIFMWEIKSAAGVLKIVIFLVLLIWVLASDLTIDGPTLLAAFIFSIFAAFITPWPSALAVIYGYYQFYLYGSLTDHRIVWVVREYHLMWLDIQLARILLPTLPVWIELWWNEQKSTLTKINANEILSWAKSLDALETVLSLKGEKNE